MLTHGRGSCCIIQPDYLLLVYSHCSQHKRAYHGYFLYMLYFITLKEHFCNFTEFVDFIWSLFGQIWPSHTPGLIDYARQRLTFAEAAWDKGGIRLYCHVHARTCACSRAWATVLCWSSPLPTEPGTRKCAVLKHGMEVSHYSNNLDVVGKTCFEMVWIA